MMSILIDEALDQWNGLVEREENAAYRFHPPSSFDEKDDGPPQQEAAPWTSYCPVLWRERICEWCYQVVDHCMIDREMVGIALFYFDKYLSRQSTQVAESESLLQLVAMTSLFLAVKLHSTRKISINSIVSLGRGCFQADQILKMELSIMNNLHWHLNPPTPSTYLNVVGPIVDACAGNAEASYEVGELSRYLLELGVCDSYFTDKSPSSVAYASLLIATENLPEFSKVQQQLAEYGLDKSPEVTELCAIRLRHVYRLAMPSPADEGEEDASAEAGLSPSFVFDAYC